MWKTRIWQPAVLDKVEKYVLILVFSILGYRMLRSYASSGDISALVYLFDQSLVLLFIVIRRKTEDITLRYDEWFVGFGGTLLPLLIAPAATGSALVTPATSVAIILVGLCIHLAAKLTLRRSFGVVAANRGVTAAGPYTIIRHPMYAGYVIVHIGFLLAGPSLYNVILIAMCWSLFVLRIRAEERVLGEDPSYREMMQRTPYRLVPGVY